MQETLSKIEIRKAYIEKISPDIILITTKDNSILEVTDLKEMKAINLKLTKGSKYGVISDTGKYSSVSVEARKHMATKGMEENRIATAYIISSLSQRMLLNAFLKINKPSVPSKSFSNYNDARKWMDSIINQ